MKVTKVPPPPGGRGVAGQRAQAVRACAQGVHMPRRLVALRPTPPFIPLWCAILTAGLPLRVYILYVSILYDILVEQDAALRSVGARRRLRRMGPCRRRSLSTRLSEWTLVHVATWPIISSVRFCPLQDSGIKHRDRRWRHTISPGIFRPLPEFRHFKLKKA